MADLASESPNFRENSSMEALAMSWIKTCLTPRESRERVASPIDVDMVRFR
ncbi:unnamed protein product, partial [Effrenium voratum]